MIPLTINRRNKGKVTKMRNECLETTKKIVGDDKGKGLGYGEGEKGWERPGVADKGGGVGGEK